MGTSYLTAFKVNLISGKVIKIPILPPYGVNGKRTIYFSKNNILSFKDGEFLFEVYDNPRMPVENENSLLIKFDLKQH